MGHLLAISTKNCMIHRQTFSYSKEWIKHNNPKIDPFFPKTEKNQRIKIHYCIGLILKTVFGPCVCIFMGSLVIFVYITKTAVYNINSFWTVDFVILLLVLLRVHFVNIFAHSYRTCTFSISHIRKFCCKEWLDNANMIPYSRILTVYRSTG